MAVMEVVERKPSRHGTEIIPFHAWVVIKPEEQYVGKIAIPDSVDLDPETMSRTGEVVAVGRGTLMDSGEFCPLESRPGDWVEYLTVLVKRIKIGGKEHHVVRDQNVIFRYGA